MKRVLYIFLFAYLLLDIAFSFIQHYNVEIDGDLSYIVLPDDHYKKAMEHPFGLNVLLNNEQYFATNRAFAHHAMSAYFKQVPLFMQHISKPIESIYLSAALAKTLIQVFLIYLLSVFISGSLSLFSRDFIISASLITPLFQTFGYNNFIGIIDLSTTYTFFYALSSGLILMFFLPYFRILYHKKKSNFHWTSILLLAGLLVILSFFGPLNPAIVLITIFLAILYQFFSYFLKDPGLSIVQIISRISRVIPGYLFILIILASLLCLYSFYIGTQNITNFAASSDNLSLAEKYAKIPGGLLLMFTSKIGPPLLILMITGNSIIISRRKQDNESKKILTLLKWICLFALLYTLLLPLGGYREYRPEIIRRDTFLPVLLMMIFYFGLSSLFLLKNMKLHFKWIYLVTIIGSLFVFIISDAEILRRNACEKEALHKIANSDQKIISLDNNCTVMEWDVFTDYHKSKINMELLRYWNVIHEEKYYYHSE